MIESWLPSFIFSFKQASFSTFGALIPGIIMGLSLLRAPPKFYIYLKTSALFFAALPSLFWISSFFWWSGLLGILPRGFSAIVTVHSFMNLGLIAIGTELIVKSRLARMSEMSHVMGVRPLLFWRKVAFPLVWKDLSFLGIAVFGFCFVSLSVPMIFSTPKELTLETLIYQWGVREGRWRDALILSLVQWITIAILALSIGGLRIPARIHKVDWNWLVRKESLLLFAVPFLFLGISYFDLIRDFSNPVFWKEFAMSFQLSALLGSLAMGFMVAMIFVLLFILLMWAGPNIFVQKFLSSFVGPSMAIMGLLLFLMPGQDIASDLLKLSLGLSLIFFPGLYRWLGESHFTGLKTQWMQARVMGASPWMIVQKIWWPQSHDVVATVTGLACLWSASDFALSSMLLQRPYSLALLAEEAFNSYRVSMGMFYSLLCLLLGGFMMFVLRKALNVRS